MALDKVRSIFMCGELALKDVSQLSTQSLYFCFSLLFDSNTNDTSNDCPC